MTNVRRLEEMRGALAQLDQERAEREALEKALKPFNPEGTPYDRETVIKEAQFFLFQHVKSGYEFGKRLVLLKAHESFSSVGMIIEERFRMPLSTAYRYEQHARLCVQSEKFRAMFDRPGMQSKGVALLAGLSDPEIQAELDKYDETGQLLGLDEAELQAKTKKELIRENKKLRSLRDKKIKDLEADNERLQGQVEGLAAAGLLPGLEKAQKLLKSGKSKLTEAFQTLAQADFGLLSEDAGAVAVIRLTIDEGRLILDELEKQAFGVVGG